MLEIIRFKLQLKQLEPYNPQNFQHVEMRMRKPLDHHVNTYNVSTESFVNIELDLLIVGSSHFILKENIID